MNNNKQSAFVAGIPASYRAKFPTVTDLDGIAINAMNDQQAGVPVTTGRQRYETVADQSHYMNMWMSSMQVNGVPKGFQR